MCERGLRNSHRIWECSLLGFAGIRIWDIFALSFLFHNQQVRKPKYSQWGTF